MKVYATYKEIMKKHLGELEPDSEMQKIVNTFGIKINSRDGLKFGKAIIENYFLGNLIIELGIGIGEETTQKRIDEVLELLKSIEYFEELEKNNWNEDKLTAIIRDKLKKDEK
jgi:hypothetical protein